jgi:hypothetical protein
MSQKNINKSKKDSRPTAKGTRTTPTEVSLFPFFQKHLASKYAPLMFSGAFFIVMLVLSLANHKIGDYDVETDFYWGFVGEAKQILNGSIPIGDFKGPGYGVTLALFKLLISDYFTAGVVLSVLCAALTLLFTYKIIARLFRPDLALLTALGVAINAVFLKYTYSAGTDMLFNVLMVVSVYFVLRNDELNLWDMVLAGLFSGYAYLTRYNGIALLVGLPIVLLFLNVNHLSWKQRFIGTAVYFAAAMLLIMPWGVYCLSQKGSFFYNANYQNVAFDIYGQGKMSWDQFWNVEAKNFTSFSDVIFRDPGAFIKKMFSNVYEHFRNDIGFLPQPPGTQASVYDTLRVLVTSKLGIFAVLGILVLAYEHINRKQVAYFIFSFLFFGVLLTVFYGPRFSLYLLPTYMLLALVFFSWKRLAFLRIGKVHLSLFIVGILFALTFVESYKAIKENISSGPGEVLQTAAWAEQNKLERKESDIIVARKPHIGYYLNMEFRSFPYVNTFPELMEELGKMKATYLFFSGIEAGLRPQFQILLDPRNTPLELTPLFAVQYPQPAVLYRINYPRQK